MRSLSEHEYTTYPRRFDAYSWHKPLLVGLLFVLFMGVFNLVIVSLVTKLLFGTVSESVGYDGMDLFTAAGAFQNGISAASVIPCLLIAAMIVRDRPVSSYFSSMGGWRWDVFLKTLAVAFVVLGIPTVVMHLLGGRTSDMQFTLGGFVILTLLVPLQGIAEELSYRGYMVQTVSSWFMMPLVGILVQVLIFTAMHPYNLVGRVEIAASAIIYALVCVLTRGLESGSALHIANNASEIYIVGLGFGSITAEQTIPAIVVNLLCKIVFVAFILYAKDKLHWFDKVQDDDVARFNAKTME